MDMIAVLDGLMPNPNTNPSGSGGANYSGGSSFYPGAPTLPSSEGLAGIEQGWMQDEAPVVDAEEDYAGYLAAFSASPFVATRGAEDVAPAVGSNYGGGSSYFPGNPTYPSSEGLAALERAFGLGQSGYVGRSINPSGSGGANYSGGSSFYSGAPTLPSSEGLAILALHGLLGLGAAPVTAVQAVRRVIARDGINLRQPVRSAERIAFDAATAAGYDRYWAASVASRVGSRARAIGWDRYATKS